MSKKCIGSCETCLFYNQSVDSYVGKCMRYPPVIINKRNYCSEDSKYPLVIHDWWCGEYSPKD